MKLLNHIDFFHKILDGKYKLSSYQNAEVYSAWEVDGQEFYIYAVKKEDSDTCNFTTDYSYCNHHHELDDTYEIVDFGDGNFVANKEALPLLKSLNELGLRTRTHHIKNDGEWAFFSILLNDDTDIEIKTINERAANRTKYNGKKELLIRWNLADYIKKKNNLPKERIPVVAKIKTNENKIIFNIIYYLNNKWYEDKTGRKLVKFHSILEWKYTEDCF